LPQSITGVFDFGDAIYSWTIVDLAVAIAYAITDSLDPVQDICQIAKGYDQVRSLSEHELTALFGLVCIRLCLSVAIAAEQSAAEPDNAYLNCSQAGIERLLPRLAAIPFPIARSMLRTALGREEDLHESSVLAWIDANQSNFAFPLAESNISPERAHRFVVLDLSVDSDIIPREIDGITEPTLTRSIDEAMLSADARIGVGRYLEPRLLYSAGQFSSLGLEQENRTIHLGIDLFAPAGTPVVAPLAGQVAYVGNIDLPLDYGGLLILSHETPGGQTFFTLYGHLDPTSLSALERGDDVELGTHIAELGAADCNGGWAPHLHFQLLLDDFDLLERFPGVALASQSRQWSQYSADPNRILGIDPSLFPPVPPTKAETRRRRKAVTGRNLSIGYSHPLKMIRGWKQYLYDETGRRFLDAYNNVPHVGHCHPRVVDAITRQARMLNTNTRYLHDNFNRLAERITETMPPGLDVCFLVNSASEANELAIRIARAATHARATIVLEGAYHGHTNTLIDLSPYKHDGRGGEGRPDWVYTAELPDLNRGRFTDPSDAGVRYADSVQRCIQEILEKDSQGLSGFLCESCPSVAGQIILPPNYLSEVYKLVRQAGGICIADEVQTGYGRLGNAMYGFELQDVVPDLVILGKPIGNGHPLAAVVTTREIADAFDTGMEYFSTFGGNPVSCAAGLAVLDVLEQEDLQANAQAVGDFLLSGLNQLAERVDPIDDVRGQGFFLGVELTRGDDRSPDAEAASFIANRMRDRGVLIGTDGIADNVLKIRPPMCFSLDDAKRLLHQLSESFLDLGY
jgi:4-aminobutyrate aminotransferase-like enzyme